MRSTLLFLLCTPLLWGQGGFEKSQKKGNDYLQVRNHGYQFSLGPTYSFVNQPLRGDLFVNQVDRGDFTITPEAKLGFYAEFGLAHFPKWKGTPIKALGKSRIMDYFDWGIGYRQSMASRPPYSKTKMRWVKSTAPAPVKDKCELVIYTGASAPTRSSTSGKKLWSRCESTF